VIISAGSFGFLSSLMMSFLNNLRMYARFAFGLPEFLRRRMSVDEARAFVRKGLVEREANFLKVVRRAIFDNPRSPYRPLLGLAKWELGDIEHSVQTKGLEPTLRELRRTGVYFTFEEYKGRAPVVRDGQVIPIRALDFDNPFAARAYEATTGGSSGVGTRVPMDLDTMMGQVPHLMLGREVNGMLDGPMAIWRGTLPDPTGVGIILRAVAYGGVPVRWFTPITRADFRPSLKNRLATSGIIAMTRLCGVPCPRPEPVPIDQAGILARWAVQAVREHGSCVIGTSVSLAVRICLAALDEGLSLAGVVFMSGGDPFTPARSRVVARAGARLVPHYISVDTGPIGMACAQPSSEDDTHLLSDRLALIQHPRKILDSDVTVDAFYFTSLRPTAAKILMNVESDDHGVVEERSCGCPFGELGYTRHVRQIRSFGKLTGEGVTLVGSEMVRILEEVLPARFGGSPLDFQLLEEEDEQGLTRLTLLVSPRLAIDSEDLVVSTVLEALGQSSVAADLARAFWQQAGTFRVRRADPVWTSRGKLLPIRVGGRPGKGQARGRTSPDSPSSRPARASTSP
jgi:hypothetical protein